MTSTITLVSHGPAGSGPSLMMHAFGDGLVETAQAEQVSVIDLPGQDGAQAILHIAAADGAGDIAGSCTPTYLTTPVKANLTVDHTHLTALAGLVEDTYLLVTRADDPRASVPELFNQPSVAAAAPRGGNTHIQAMLLDRATAAPITVKFFPDLGAATRSVRSGVSDWTTGVTSDFRADVDAGVLAVVASFADSADSDIPTLTSRGIDVRFSLWRGLIGPPGLTAEQVETWTKRVSAVQSSKAWNAYLLDTGLRNAPLTPTQFRALLDAEDRNYRDWLTDLARSQAEPTSQSLKGGS